MSTNPYLESKPDIPRAVNYFVLNEDDDSKIDFKYEMKKKKLIRDQKGAKGILYMLVSAAFFSLMAFILKLLYLHSDINTYEVTYWQSLVIGILNFSLFKVY